MAKDFNRSGLELMDLIQEGNGGLLHAAEKFDYMKGFRFSTYATSWIKQKIKRYIDNYRRIIRFPVHIEETIAKVNEAKRLLEEQLNKIPSTEEISLMTKISVEKIEIIELLPYVSNLLDKTDEINNIPYKERISDLNILSPSEQAAKDEKEKFVSELLNSINEKEELVLKYRYGFDGREYTLKEIAEIMNLSNQRIRQIEQTAIKKIRNKFYDEIINLM